MILRWLINAAALFLTAYIVPGIEVDGPAALILAAAVLGVVNAFIRPVLLILTLPLNFLTLGLFTFLLNALLFWLVAFLVEGLSIQGFSTALLGSIIISIISGVLSAIIR